jgi:adenine-specific DNA-methyltransferase
MSFDLENRRYIGSKNTLAPWIFDSIPKSLSRGVFFDVFSGTGIVAKKAIMTFDHIILNDLLYSNEVIYRAFFGDQPVDESALSLFFEEAKKSTKRSNYFSKNFGGKYFTIDDARHIGFVREQIDTIFPDPNDRTRHVALASLLYSVDRCANTVGHYETFLKNQKMRQFRLEPIRSNSCSATIFRENANDLARKVSADVAYVDPPYNSRQYSRFYHVLETLTKWDKPKLSGVALKPPTENSSLYCTVRASATLADLIENLDAKYVVISYNNTYSSKSSSSKNKISHEEIRDIARSNGRLTVKERDHKFFNSGKTDFKNHVEYLFLIEK